MVRLLQEAEAEPLLWEAKGQRLDKHDIRKNVCAFANGNDAGYLILGAEQGKDGWSLPGWEFPDEPPTWVSSVVGDGVVPIPRIDVRPLPGESDNRRVAVVEVLPIATPPCFSRGTIYERSRAHGKDNMRSLGQRSRPKLMRSSGS